MTVTTQASARRQGRRVVDRLARLGLAARGVVYLLVAWLAIRVAFFHSGQQADRQGAMRQIAHNTAGKALLLAMAVGFFGYAAWRIVQAVSGFPDEDGAKEWGKRAVSAGRALLYLAFAYSAARTALSGQSGSGSDRPSKRATAGGPGPPGGGSACRRPGALGWASARRCCGGRFHHRRRRARRSRCDAQVRVKSGHRPHE